MEFHLLNVLDITIAWVAGFHAAKYCGWASTLPGEMQQAKVVGRHPGRIRAGEQLAGKVLLRVAHFTEWNGRKLPIAAGIATLLLIWLMILWPSRLVLLLPGLRWFPIANPMDFAPGTGRRGLVISLLSEMRHQQGAF